MWLSKSDANDSVAAVVTTALVAAVTKGTGK